MRVRNSEWLRFHLLMSTFLLLSACVDINTPDEYETIKFAGLTTVELDKFGRVSLNWEAVNSSIADASIRYRIYQLGLASDMIPESNLLLSSANPLPVKLDLDDLPSQQGELIATVTDTSYLVDTHLLEGEVYAFQVVATDGLRKDINVATWGLRYTQQFVVDEGRVLNIKEGNFQLGLIGQELNTPLTVQLQNNGDPVAGEAVTFEIIKGTGEVHSPQAVSDQGGLASTKFTVGDNTGTIEVAVNWRGIQTAKFVLLTQKSQLSDESKLAIVSGNFQTGPTGHLFDLPLVVRFTTDGEPVSDEMINWTVMKGDGASLSSGQTRTDSLGLTKAFFTSGLGQGPYLVKAETEDQSRTVEFQLIGLATDSKITIVEGNHQRGIISATFPTELQVRLTSNGIAVHDELVRFNVVSGTGASLSSPSSVTDNSGKAAVSFVAGATKGNYVVTATWDNIGASTSFFLEAIDPTDNVKLRKIAGDLQTGNISTGFSIPLKVELTNGDAPFVGETVDFSITAGSGANLSVGSQVTDSNGNAQINFTAGAISGPYQITASWNGGKKSIAFTVFAEDSSLGVNLASKSGNHQEGLISTQFAEPLKVKLTQNNQPYVGQEIVFTLIKGSGALINSGVSATVTTNSSGEAVISFDAGTTVGTYMVNASWNGGVKETNFILTAKHPADGISLDIVNGNLQTGGPQSALSNPLVVKLTKDNIPFPGETIQFSVVTGSGASLGSSTATTDSSGLASTVFTGGPTVGTYEILASWSNGLRDTTFAVVVEEDDNTALEIIDGNFQTGPTSATFAKNLKVKVSDSGNPLANETVGFVITSIPQNASGQSISAATVTSNASGFAAVDFDGGDAEGTYEVTASWNQKIVKFALFTDGSLASKVIKIVQAGVGSQPEITTTTLDLATDTLTVKAALYDMSGSTYISDASVSWSLTGGGFNSADLSGNPIDAVSIMFDPTRAGTTTLNANYMGADSSVVGTSDSTGFLTVETTLVPEVISIVAGDNQTAVVGSNLSTPLKVKVTNSSAVPVPGVGVNFTYLQGGGVVTTGQPVVTDADGFAAASVKLGTQAVSSVIRAQVVSAPSLTQNFGATAKPGAAAQLAFSTEPGLAFENFKFLQQPIIIVQDSYGNLVQTANNQIDLVVAAGTGSLSGVTSIAAAGGIATFHDVAYNTEETNVQLRGQSGTLDSSISQAFDVAVALASACTTESISFKTEGGGCKDQSTGYVWSGRLGAMTWDAAFWDSGVSGASTAEVSDNGWTNEYPTNSSSNCAGYRCDSEATAHCHDLYLGGYDDWRLPALNELQSARSNGLHTHQSLGSSYYWSVNGYHYSRREFKTYRFSDNRTDRERKYNSEHVICVRGGTPKPPRTQLQWAGTIPNGVLVNSTFTLYARVKDAAGLQVNAEGIQVNLATASGSGSLSGTTSVLTDKSGKATFNVAYNIAEEATFSISASGLTSPSPTSTITFKANAGDCDAANDASWVSTEGGCKHVATALVWSTPSSSKMPWGDAIWDNKVSGSAAVEASDNGWSNEYSPWHAEICQTKDSSACDDRSAAYCHDLNEGGYDDWRFPTEAQLTGAASAGIAGRVGVGSQYYWANTYDNTDSYERRRKVRLTDGHVTDQDDYWDLNYVVCVRNPPALSPPSKIVFVDSHSHAQVNQLFSVKAQIETAAGTKVNRSGINVTIALDSGSGVLSGDQTVATDRMGRAVFTELAYDTEEPISFSLTNNGGLSNGDNRSLNLTGNPGGCTHDTVNWDSIDGGCKHLGSGLVFSAISTTEMTWGMAVWDSARSGNTAPDSDDNGRTNDYDGGSSGANDDSNSNYCHDLVEGGRTDWRLPTLGEFYAVAGAQPQLFIGGSGSINNTVWTGKHHSSPGCRRYKKTFRFSDLSQNYDRGGGSCGTLGEYKVICVRD